MGNISPNPRQAEYDIDTQFLDRWSPRAFDESALTEEEIGSLFEAARFAPSCFNEQPWIFVFTRDAETKSRFISTLTPKNALWAQKAPLLIFILAQKTFSRNGKENRFAAFDAGAAWMSLALQARKLGLYAHAMAGYDSAKAYEATGANPEKHLMLAAIAVGRHGDVELLPDDLKAVESPNQRKPQTDFVFEGRLRSGK